MTVLRKHIEVVRLSLSDQDDST